MASTGDATVYSLNAATDLLDRAKLVTPGGVHSNVRLATRPHPMFFDRGQGVHLWDEDGNRYVDFVLGQGASLIGHAHPAVVHAVRDALSRGQLFAAQVRSEVELGELLCEVLPCAERVRFSSTGSEAVQAALRLARATTGRKRILKFEGHYHGWLDNVLVSVSPKRLPGERSRTATAESRGQVVPSPQEITVLPWNDIEAVANELREGDVAAVIMEPIAANQSVILPQDGYLEAVRSACDKSGTLLIFDEIITGLRVAIGGAHALFGIMPDLALFGKAMASGFPISAIVGRANVFDGVGTGDVVHAGTYNANVTSVAAALATVRMLRDDPGFYDRAAGLGSRLADGLREVATNELIVQGMPQIVWMGFGPRPVSEARDLLAFDEERTATLSGEMLVRGVHVTARGTWYLSGTHEPEDVDRALEAFSAAFAATEAQ
jgi:glutamate-1-semialdehyde 2,1-aminomutase